MQSENRYQAIKLEVISCKCKNNHKFFLGAGKFTYSLCIISLTV